MIYFDEKQQRRVVDFFKEAMAYFNFDKSIINKVMSEAAEQVS